MGFQRWKPIPAYPPTKPPLPWLISRKIDIWENWGHPLASLCQEGDQHPADKQHIYLFTPSLVSFASVISLQGIGLKKAPHQSPIWIKTVGPANNGRYFFRPWPPLRPHKNLGTGRTSISFVQNQWLGFVAISDSPIQPLFGSPPRRRKQSKVDAGVHSEYVVLPTPSPGSPTSANL